MKRFLKYLLIIALLSVSASFAHASTFTVPQGGTGFSSTIANGVVFATGTSTPLATDSDFIYQPGTSPIFHVGDLQDAGNGTKELLDDTQKKIKFSTGHVFEVNDTSDNQWFEVNTSSDTDYVGDVTDATDGTLLTVDASVGDITNAVASDFYVEDTNENEWVDINPSSLLEIFGDINGVADNLTFTLDASGGAITAAAPNDFYVADTNGHYWLDASPSGNYVKEGDVSDHQNGTTLETNDEDENVTVTATTGYDGSGSSNSGFNVVDINGGEWMSLNPISGIFNVGDVSNEDFGTTIGLDDPARLISFTATNLEFTLIGDSGSGASLNTVFSDGSRNTYFQINPTNFYVNGGNGAFVDMDTVDKYFGIGTNAPSALLDVEGPLNGTIFKVDDNAQYVTISATFGFNVNSIGNAPWFNISPSNEVAELGDLEDTINGTTEILNDATKSTSFTNAIATVPQYENPTTGGTVTSNSSTQLILDPSGSLLALTIVLPPSPVDGQQFWVTSTQTITTLTFSGGTIIGNPTGIALGSAEHYVYSASASEWIAN